MFSKISRDRFLCTLPCTLSGSMVSTPYEEAIKCSDMQQYQQESLFGAVV